MKQTSVKREEKRRRLTLADVDAGRVIDHRAVQAWAGSLDSNDPLPVPYVLRLRHMREDW